MFGGETPKPLKLYSSDPWVLHLQRRLVRSKFPDLSKTTKRYTSSTGRRRFVGTKELKRTQVYTRSFGNHVPWHALYAYIAFVC